MARGFEILHRLIGWVRSLKWDVLQALAATIGVAVCHVEVEETNVCVYVKRSL